MLSDGRFYKEDVFIKCVVCLPVPSLTAHTEITEKVSFGQMMIYSDVELDEVRGDELCKRTQRCTQYAACLCTMLRCQGRNIRQRWAILEGERKMMCTQEKDLGASLE